MRPWLQPHILLFFQSLAMLVAPDNIHNPFCPQSMDLPPISPSTQTPPTLKSNRGTRDSRVWLLWPLSVILLGIAIYYFSYDVRSYSWLRIVLDPTASNLLLRWETRPVETQEITLSMANGSVRARLYMPLGIAHPPGMVVAHGIHHLGIDEPRLMSFARAAAGNGFAVLTPEIAALADYRVDGASIDTIGESLAWLQQRRAADP